MAERLAYAVTHDDPPQVFLADDELVLSRVLALKLVAATPADTFPTNALAEIREALLEERWADALVAWMEHTGILVDVYPPTETLWTDELLDEEQTLLELRVAPIFNDGTDDAG